MIGSYTIFIDQCERKKTKVIPGYRKRKQETVQERKLNDRTRREMIFSFLFLLLTSFFYMCIFGAKIRLQKSEWQNQQPTRNCPGKPISVNEKVGHDVFIYLITGFFFFKFSAIYFWVLQEYVPVHDRVAPRQSWEVDQLLESSTGGEA